MHLDFFDCHKERVVWHGIFPRRGGLHPHNDHRRGFRFGEWLRLCRGAVAQGGRH